MPATTTTTPTIARLHRATLAAQRACEAARLEREARNERELYLHAGEHVLDWYRAAHAAHHAADRALAAARAAEREARKDIEAHAAKRAAAEAEATRLALLTPEARRAERAAKASATRTARRETQIRAAVLGAYGACGYRTAGGRWAGGEHDTRVVVAEPSGAQSPTPEAREALRDAQARYDAVGAAGGGARYDALHGAGEGVRAWTGLQLAQLRARPTTAVVSPAASGDSTRAWSRNGKWSGLNSSHTLTVRPTWQRDVGARGLAVVRDAAAGADRLVLDCDEVRGPLAHVLVVLPSRGFDLRTEWRWVEVQAAQSVEVRP